MAEKTEVLINKNQKTTRAFDDLPVGTYFETLTNKMDHVKIKIGKTYHGSGLGTNLVNAVRLVDGELVNINEGEYVLPYRKIVITLAE